MAGTLQRAGVRILRRATAFGLAGLAVAIFIGVMAFALTTSSAGQADESHTQYLTTASRIADLTTVATSRIQQLDASGIIPRGPVSQSAIAGIAGGGADGTPEALPLMMSRIEEDPESGVEVAAARSIDAPTVAAEPLVPIQEPLTVLTTPAGTTPDLAPGEHWEATVSFYYCEQGSRGRHPGDGGRFCGHMRNGDIVYDGAAACEYKYLGQRFRILGDPTERVYTCADTGNAVLGLHRDIWFHNSDDGWDWQLIVGQVATIEIVE